MLNLNPKITAAGLSLFPKGVATPGASVAITAVAIGSQSYSPVGNETALKGEFARFPVNGGAQLGGTQVHIGFTITDTDRQNRSTSSQWIGEIGFYIGDTLFAVLSKPAPAFFYKSQGIDIPIAYTLDISALPAGSVTINTSASPSALSSMLAGHELKPNAHADLVAALAAANARITTYQIGQAGGIVGKDTLSSLNAAIGYPPDTIAYVTNDPAPLNNGIYRKKGAAGAGGWVQSNFDRVALLERKVINDKEVSFFAPRKNLFDKGAVTFAKYCVETGQIYDNPAYDLSEYIPVTPGQTYTGNAQGMRFICFFDGQYNVIPGGSEGVSPFTAPLGAAFVRVTMFHDDLNIFQLERGATQTTYEPFTYELRLKRGVAILPRLSDLPDHWLTGQKIALDAIERDNLKAGSVSPEKTNFLQVGKNKFNKATVAHGKYLTETGAWGDNAAYVTSDYIRVVPGPYKGNTTGIRFSCHFDKDKNVVLGGYGGSVSIDSLNIPQGVEYIRITTGDYGKESFQLEPGTTSTAFESFGFNLRDADGTPIRVEAIDSGSPGEPAIEAPVLATTHYVPAGKELALYYENVVKDFRAHAGRIGISSSLPDEPNSPTRETGEARKLLPLPGQVNTTVNGSATVVGSSFDFVAGAAGKWYQVRISDPANTTPVNIQNFGDSFSGRMTFVNVLNATPAAAGITYSGNRTANSTNQTVKCEGQGGWTMESYFTVDNRGYLSPFMQPVNNYKHFGPTSFWIDANSASPSYNATYFFGIRDQFDAVTGRKKAPAVGDVMSEGGGYIVWTGAAWAAITLATLGGFAFSYAKYRAVWGIPRPDILHVLLGTNDFYSADTSTFPGTYAVYKARYEQLIASVKADSPACKIIVGIPVSSGRQGEYGTLNTERVKRAMWLLAKHLVADFDGREAEGIYLLDYHSIVHRVYGFDSVPEKPGADYGGADTYKYTTDITHCSQFGFDQMGNAYYGLVQYLRSRL